jgi:hypothetical protein
MLEEDSQLFACQPPGCSYSRHEPRRGSEGVPALQKLMKCAYSVLASGGANKNNFLRGSILTLHCMER